MIEKKIRTLKSTSVLHSGEKSRDTDVLKNFIEICSPKFSYNYFIPRPLFSPVPDTLLFFIAIITLVLSESVSGTEDFSTEATIK